VGLGDVDTMPGGRRSSRHQLDGDDDGRAAREHDTGMVGGWVECVHDTTRQQRQDGIAVGDGAWGRSGIGGLYNHGSWRADRMRGHRVGVRDVNTVHAGAWNSRLSAHRHDGWQA